MTTVTKLQVSIFLMSLDMDDVPVAIIAYNKPVDSVNMNLRNVTTKGLKKYKAQKGSMKKLQMLAKRILEHEFSMAMIDSNTAIRGTLQIFPSRMEYEIRGEVVTVTKYDRKAIDSIGKLFNEE